MDLHSDLCRLKINFLVLTSIYCPDNEKIYVTHIFKAISR